MITSIRMHGSGRPRGLPVMSRRAGGREMHRMGLWWRQPDHYDWLSDYLAARGLKPFVRYLLAAILTNLAAATLLMLFSSWCPQPPMRRAVPVPFVVSRAAIGLVWPLSWRGRFQSQMF